MRRELDAPTIGTLEIGSGTLYAVRTGAKSQMKSATQ